MALLFPGAWLWCYSRLYISRSWPHVPLTPPPFVPQSSYWPARQWLHAGPQVAATLFMLTAQYRQTCSAWAMWVPFDSPPRHMLWNRLRSTNVASGEICSHTACLSPFGPVDVRTSWGTSHEELDLMLGGNRARMKNNNLNNKYMHGHMVHEWLALWLALSVSCVWVWRCLSGTSVPQSEVWRQICIQSIAPFFPLEALTTPKYSMLSLAVDLGGWHKCFSDGFKPDWIVCTSPASVVGYWGK